MSSDLEPVDAPPVGVEEVGGDGRLGPVVEGLAVLGVVVLLHLVLDGFEVVEGLVFGIDPGSQFVLENGGQHAASK